MTGTTRQAILDATEAGYTVTFEPRVYAPCEPIPADGPDVVMTLTYVAGGRVLQIRAMLGRSAIGMERWDVTIPETIAACMRDMHAARAAAASGGTNARRRDD